jgi:hypothetical protein
MIREHQGNGQTIIGVAGFINKVPALTPYFRLHKNRRLDVR